MAQVNITLAASHTVTKGPRDKSWEASTTVDLSKLSADIVAKLVIHGLHQKIADAASGAKTEAEAQALMDKAADAILAGSWSSRVAGEGVDELTKIARSIVRKTAKAQLGAKSEAWAKFTGLDDASQNAKLDEWYAAQPDAFAAAIQAEVQARKIAREGLKATQAAVSFGL